MFSNRRAVTADTLSAEMDFDHIIYSHGDGTVSDVNPYVSLWGPDVYIYEQEDGTWTEGHVESPWSLLTGFTGQYAYSGPQMHSSEYIGGDLARYILETPGFYIAFGVIPMPLDDEGDDTPDTWVVAYTETAGV